MLGNTLKTYEKTHSFPVIVEKHGLTYNSTTGVFTWTTPRSNRNKVGSRAGCVNKAGYRVVRWDGKLTYEHRLAWFFITGSWPVGVIDHINQIKGDNRIDNLRDVNHEVNNTNTSAKGWWKVGDKYRSRIRVKEGYIHLGYFGTAEEAEEVYNNAKASKLEDLKKAQVYLNWMVESKEGEGID